MEEKYLAAEKLVKKVQPRAATKSIRQTRWKQKAKLLDEILTLDFNQVEELYKRIGHTVDFSASKIKPIDYTDKSALSEEELKHYEEIGLKEIKSRKTSSSNNGWWTRNKIRT